jgi:hypothetical protein
LEIFEKQFMNPEFSNFLEKQQFNSNIFEKVEIPLIHDCYSSVKPIVRSLIQCEHPARTNAYEQKLYEVVRPVVA